MAEEPIEAIDVKDYQIGYHNQGEVMVVTIPLKAWASDKNYGDIKVSGVFVKAERIALKNLQLLRVEQEKAGLVKPQPGVIPMPTGRG